MYYKTFYKMRDDRSYKQWPIVQEAMGVLRSNETSEVMIFEQKVRLVSPFAAAEVLVSVLRH